MTRLRCRADSQISDAKEGVEVLKVKFKLDERAAYKLSEAASLRSFFGLWAMTGRSLQRFDIKARVPTTH